MLHPHIVGIGEHQRHIMIDEISNASNLLKVNLSGYFSDMASVGYGLDFLGESIHSLSKTIGISTFLHTEHGKDTLTTRDVLIQRNGLLLIAANGQEIVNILVIRQRSHHRHQYDSDASQQPTGEAATFLQYVEYM